MGLADVMQKTSEYCLVVSLDWKAGLRIVRRSCEVFNTKQGAERCNEFAGKLCTVVGEEIPGLPCSTA